jgi:hypothetical protein
MALIFCFSSSISFPSAGISVVQEQTALTQSRSFVLANADRYASAPRPHGFCTLVVKFLDCPSSWREQLGHMLNCAE